MAGSLPNFHKMDSRSACIQGVLKVKVKVEVKGHVIRTLSWILGMSYSVIDGIFHTYFSGKSVFPYQKSWPSLWFNLWTFQRYYFRLYIYRRLPLQLLNLFVLWFSISETCVRWGSHDSHFFKLTAGVRQGGVLSPYFFAIFVDDIVNKIVECNTGCYVRNICISIFLYADDIILLCPSIGGLQRLLRVSEQAIEEIDMKINATKTVCMRIGPRSDATYAMVPSWSGLAPADIWACTFLEEETLDVHLNMQKRNYICHLMLYNSKIGRFVSKEVVLNLLNVYRQCYMELPCSVATQALAWFCCDACIYENHAHRFERNCRRVPEMLWFSARESSY